MLRFEWKKLLLYRKGLLLIAVFLIAELMGMILLTKPYDKDLEANRAVYDRYLSQVEGPLTVENQQFLEDEMLQLNTANAKLEQLKSDYYQGALAEDEFRASFDILADENADYPGFSKLYTQYIYVRESEDRSFLYTGGWEVLLGDQEPDYLFLLSLIFLIAPIFCQEYSNQMDQILLTQKRSAKYQWQTKVAISLILTAGLTAVLQVFELIYCASMFGLPHWDYSLQSLYSFGSVQKNLTLGQAFFLQFALKEIGYLYMALLILCISVLVKKYAFVLMAAMLILLIPFLTVNSISSLRLIPGPWALTIGNIYLNGESLLLNGGVAEALSEVTWAELTKVLVLSAVICLGMLLCIRHKNTNHHLRIKRCRMVAALLSIMLLFPGCSRQAEPLYYNSKQSNCFESEQYIVFSDGLGGYYFLDKQTDTMYNFPLDAFQDETAKITGSFYSANEKLYYLKAQQQALTGNAEAMTEYFSLIELDLATMNECVTYQWEQNTKWFFGVLDKDSAEPSPYYIDSFFLYEGKLYYPSDDTIYRMDLQSGQYEAYLQLPNAGTNLAYDGTNLYYTDQYNRLSILNLKTENIEVLDSIVARDFVYTPDGIYFLNIRDNNTLYYWNDFTQIPQQLDDTEAYALYWDENYCWIDSLDGLFRLNHDGSLKTYVSCPGFVCCISTDTAMYISDYESGILYSVEKNTLQYAKFTQ